MFVFFIFGCTVSENDATNITFDDIQSYSSSSGNMKVSAIPSEWDGYNNPSLVLGDTYSVDFFDFPLAAELSVEPWSGYYWPEQKGGISYRWRSGESFDLDLYSKDIVVNDLTISDIERLSPAEKYDLFVGNYDWPLTMRSLSQTSPNEASWTGYCHGWAPASMDYIEPKPIILENPDGVRIPFGSSDIKALLTYYQADVVTSQNPGHPWRAEQRVLGGACGSGKPMDPACYDTNPATFHLILSNMIGLRGEGFIMDVDSTYEKWNQPVFAYDSQIIAERQPSEYSSSRSVKEYIIENTVSWTVEIEPTYTPVLYTNGQSVKEQVYLYSIEVDEQEHIIGGQWLTKTQNGNFVTLPEAWDYLVAYDENEDGQPDLSQHQAAEIIWQHFSIPDYIWTQNNVDFPEHYENVPSKYSIIATTNSSREDLYYYMGHIQDIYYKSIE